MGTQKAATVIAPVVQQTTGHQASTTAAATASPKESLISFELGWAGAWTFSRGSIHPQSRRDEHGIVQTLVAVVQSVDVLFF